MPTRIKAILSIILVLFAYLLYRLRGMMSPDLPVFVIPALAAFMVVSLWLFPEARKGK